MTEPGLSIDERAPTSTGDNGLVTDLLEAARAARRMAYVPYSRFAMGAAARLADGSIVRGSAVENVSLGLAMCAERAALFASVAAGGAAVKELALVSPRTDGRLTFPCGACLQVAMELGGPDVMVHAADSDGEELQSVALSDLLPQGPIKDRARGASV